ncbi:helix-turn-helix domain-containing protein [Saccharothrix carnea]|uniref:helix-turn-helix domain-containing protein n=1 Tax=Saccharothrix carnea TaxID=1280637 RepID=UPI001FE38254|nr:helix-turn-helix transcriptional regulator [Saccharothrix carnea]
MRLASANRGIWKASELQRLLAERGLVISAGKMSHLWSGQPVSLKLDDPDVICVVLGCPIDELLIPEPDQGPPAGARRAARGRYGFGGAADASCAASPGRSFPATGLNDGGMSDGGA